MTLLTEYIIALTYLYGILDKNKIVEIYNSQNEDLITITDVDTLLKNPPEELLSNFVTTHKGYFIRESLINFDEFDILLAKKS